MLIIIVHQRFKMLAYTDRAALCREILSCDPGSTRRSGMHHWCAWVEDQDEVRNPLTMQAVSCAVCGNYHQVSTIELQYALLHTARHIMCEDLEHERITQEAIRRETESAIIQRPENSDSDTETLTEIEDDELGSPPVQNPVLVRSDDWQSHNLNDWETEDELYDWETAVYYPNQ